MAAELGGCPGKLQTRLTLLANLRASAPSCLATTTTLLANDAAPSTDSRQRRRRPLASRVKIPGGGRTGNGVEGSLYPVWTDGLRFPAPSWRVRSRLAKR